MGPTEKIHAHDYDKEIDSTINKLKSRPDILPRNKELILNFVNDCLAGYTVVGKEKKKISKAGIRKYIFSLIVAARHFKVGFDEVEKDNKTEPNIRQFLSDLESNKIKASNALKGTVKSYKEKTKRDIKVTFKKFYKWLFGDNIIYPACVTYVDTSYEKGDVPALSREEILYWANRESTLRRKAMILFLFDAGVRAEEEMNVRMKHVSYDEAEKAYKIRVEFSKTKPRTIYIPIATEILRQYIDSYEDKDDPNAQLFPVSYDGMRKFIGLSAKEHLKKNVTPHTLRHSSATYYCTLLNSYQLCYRYGWSMSSDMPSRYIDREGLVDKGTSKAVKAEQHSELSEENRKLKEELHISKQNMQQELEAMKKEMLESQGEMYKKLLKEIKSSVKEGLS